MLNRLVFNILKNRFHGKAVGFQLFHKLDIIISWSIANFGIPSFCNRSAHNTVTYNEVF